MKVALYARVSTDEDRQLQDPEVQLQRLRRYAESREFQIAPGCEFRESKSGMDDDRPILKEMMRLAELQRRPFDGILVFKCDRLTRKAFTLFDLLKRLKAVGVTLISTEESLDTSSIYSEGMILMLGIVAGWEHEGHMQRVKAGVAKAQRQGTRSGRPFGRPRRGTELKGPRKAVPSLEITLAEIERRPDASEVQLAIALGIPRATLHRYLVSWAAQNSRVADYLSKRSKARDDHKHLLMSKECSP